jgi:hypothetical protein
MYVLYKMGGSTSIPADAYMCKYNKASFNQKLDIIRDAHDVSQYYAALLLLPKLPIKLDYYKNYSQVTEEYFNPTRKNELPDLGMSYYQYYQYLDALQKYYEATDIADSDRRIMLSDIFNKCYTVQKYIIEDLWEDCNGQTPYRIESQGQQPQE